MRKTATTILTIFMCIFMFTGCFAGSTLEERVSQRDRDRFAEAIAKSDGFSDFFDHAELDFTGNHMYVRAYIGVYLDQSEQIALKSQLLNMNEDAQIEDIKDKIEKAYRIRPTIVTMEFYTSDRVLLGKVEH